MDNKEINFHVRRALGRGWMPIPDYCAGEDILHVPGKTKEPRAKCIKYLVVKGVISVSSVV